MFKKCVIEEEKKNHTYKSLLQKSFKKLNEFERSFQKSTQKSFDI